MSPSYDYDDSDDDYDDADDHHHDVFAAGEKDGDKHGTTTAAEKHEQQLWKRLWSIFRFVIVITLVIIIVIMIMIIIIAITAVKCQL